MYALGCAVPWARAQWAFLAGPEPLISTLLAAKTRTLLSMRGKHRSSEPADRVVWRRAARDFLLCPRGSAKARVMKKQRQQGSSSLATPHISGTRMTSPFSPMTRALRVIGVIDQMNKILT